MTFTIPAAAPFADVLAKDAPGQQRREESLEVQEKRHLRGRTRRQAEHQ
jgi:hypothetical protein